MTIHWVRDWPLAVIAAVIAAQSASLTRPIDRTAADGCPVGGLPLRGRSEMSAVEIGFIGGLVLGPCRGPSRAEDAVPRVAAEC